GGRGKIVILGDSLATGYGTSGYDIARGHGYQATSYAWPSRWDKKANTTMANLARNGAMASDFIADGVQNRQQGPFEPKAVQRIKSVQPNLVIIQLGGNEYVTDRDPERTYEVNLRRLAWRIKQAAPKARMLFVHTYAFDYRDPNAAPYDHSWSRYGSVMRTVAGSYGWYMDLTEYMPATRFNGAGLYIHDEYGPGLAVHATDAGHIALFSAYWGKVQCR
ncbi:MAG: SGNH/GDSL hydrolase family protein, partial [Pseudonocardiaceae bacterium]